MMPSTRDLERSLTKTKAHGRLGRPWVSPYKAMKAIAQGEPRPPAPNDLRYALEQRLQAVERREFLMRVAQVLAWFGSLLVLEGD